MGVFDPLLESTTPGRVSGRSLHDRGDRARRPLAGSTRWSTPRSSGRLLQPPAVARADRSYPAGGVRGRLLSEVWLQGRRGLNEPGEHQSLR